jgi:hypothetical protein
VVAEGLAFTAHGFAAVVREEMLAAPAVAALELRVRRIDDHREGARTEILAAPAWRWKGAYVGCREARCLPDGFFRKTGDARSDHRSPTSGGSPGHYSLIDELVPEQLAQRVSAAHCTLPSSVG